jgi:hypothetical protein
MAHPAYSRVKPVRQARDENGGENRRSGRSLNSVFTLDGKKSDRGLRTARAIHLPLTDAGSTESQPGSFASTSNVGAT